MKIAVASSDGKTVATSLATAEGVAVFAVSDNEVTFDRLRRRRGGKWRQAEAPSLEGAEPSAVPEANGFLGVGDRVPEDLLREILDCAVVVAGRVFAVEEAQLQRLGILVLPAAAGEPAEAAVRFVVAASPLGSSAGCGGCCGKSAGS